MHGITGFGVDEYIIPGTILFLFFLSSLSILLICKNKIIIKKVNPDFEGTPSADLPVETVDPGDASLFGLTPEEIF